MNDSIELPANISVEQSVLGQIIDNHETYFHVVDFLKPEHFFNHSHQRLYSLLQDRIDSGKSVTPVALCNKLEGVDLEGIGGQTYLARLVGSALSTINTKEYGEIILDMARRRRVIAIARETISKAFNTSNGDADGIIEALEQDIHEVGDSEVQSEGLAPVSDAVDMAIDQVDLAMNLKEGEISGVSTGLKLLNNITGGLFPGELIILAGRPAMGKTALALNIAKGAAKAGHETAFFSLEMQKYELGLRLISDMTHGTKDSDLPYFDARTGNFNEYQFTRFKSGGERAALLPLHITDKSNASVTTVRMECLKLRRKLEKQGKALGLVIIDYLQLMSAGERYRGNRTSEVTEISRSLKNMAKEFNVPFLVLSQLSRNLEHRDDKRPIMSDLRESGAIEQDADMIMFVYREHEYIKNKEPKDPEKYVEWADRCERLEREMEVIIAKQRKGPTGSQTLIFSKETSAVRG